MAGCRRTQKTQNGIETSPVTDDVDEDVAEPRKPRTGLKPSPFLEVDDVLAVAEPRKPRTGLKQPVDIYIDGEEVESQNPENPERD